MKKIISVIIALTFMTFLCPMIDKSDTRTYEQCKKITIKNDTFPEDYSCNVKDVHLFVKKGSSYKGFCQIKKVIEETEDCFLDGLGKVVFTPEDVLVASGQVTAEELKSMKNPPIVNGTYGHEDDCNVIYIKSRTDANKISEVFAHELIHHIDYREKTLERDICVDEDFQNICKKIRTYNYKTEKVKRYFFKMSDDEVLACCGTFLYIDCQQYYGQLFEEICPEFRPLMDSWFNDIRERYEEEGQH